MKLRNVGLYNVEYVVSVSDKHGDLTDNYVIQDRIGEFEFEVKKNVAYYQTGTTSTIWAGQDLGYVYGRLMFDSEYDYLYNYL